MANLGMRSGRTVLTFNNVSPLTNPYEIGIRGIGPTTTLASAKGYVDTAISRGEILVLLLHDISENPSGSGWYTDRFEDLVDYIISQGVPILTMDELYSLQSHNIKIPQPINGSCWDVVVLDEYTLTVSKNQLLQALAYDFVFRGPSIAQNKEMLTQQAMQWFTTFGALIPPHRQLAFAAQVYDVMDLKGRGQVLPDTDIAAALAAAQAPPPAPPVAVPGAEGAVEGAAPQAPAPDASGGVQAPPAEFPAAA